MKGKRTICFVHMRSLNVIVGIQCSGPESQLAPSAACGTAEAIWESTTSVLVFG